MNYELLCTIHNFRFGFDKPPEGVEPALLRCPVCMRNDYANALAKIDEVTTHRDLLLGAIDLRKTVKRLVP
jgi:hypothetical protein